MTPDVNILIAASRQDHAHHAPALAWLEAALGNCVNQPLAILPMVASGFLRLTTHPKVFVEPTPLKAAQAFLRAVLDAPGVTMPPLGEEWPLFEQLCTQHKLGGNAIPDAWIAAAAQSNHLQLVTFDKDFRRLMKPGMVTVLPTK
ncbi:MAG TPA: TA system VapC family ribonuclease toxin [Gallionella sp.]|nr:TA system VapC family ribonuclease toxin [Gallionella sp.]